jgi:hypothetical protein
MPPFVDLKRIGQMSERAKLQANAANARSVPDACGGSSKESETVR